MVDEGILTNYQAPGETMLLRFTHDRFFEIMMARHLMHVLARDGFSRIPAAHLLAQWLAELSEVPIYLDVMAWMLSMVQRHRVILDRDNSAASAPEEGPNDGVLYRFEAVPPDEKYEDLMLDIAGRDEPRFRLVMHRALVLAGRDPKGAAQVQDIVLKLSRKTMEKGLDPSRLLALGQLSLGIATELGLRKPFHNLGVHPADKVRALTVAYAYYFWKKDHKAGLALLSEMEQGIYGPLSIPKPKNLEYFVGLCVLLLFRHPTDTETTSHILGLLRSLLKKSGVWIKAAGLALPPLLQSVLKDIPSDYNPVNLEELRRGKKDLADRPQLRQVLSEYARFLRADAVDVQRQREIVSTIQRLSPNNNLCYCIHQLVQAFRASYDLNGAVLSETEFAMTAAPEHHMWIQAPLYTTLWLTSGEARLDDETFLAIEKLWAKNIETGNFAYAALVPGSAYHNWNIYYAAFTLMKQRGGPHLPEVRILFDKLLANTDQRGIVAFFRGLDIVGAELSSLYPDTLRLVHATVTDLSDTGRPLPQFALERIAATLERIRALSYDEVESVLDSIRDREARERLRRQMAVQRSDKNATRLNIGTLASVGGQDFYLRAMADRDLRLLFADLMDLLVNARSLGKFVSKAISRLRSALAAQ
jgi:hypothetical protein